MSREANKLLRERDAVEKIIREAAEPDVVAGAREMLAEIDARLGVMHIHSPVNRVQ